MGWEGTFFWKRRDGNDAFLCFVVVFCFLLDCFGVCLTTPLYLMRENGRSHHISFIGLFAEPRLVKDKFLAAVNRGECSAQLKVIKDKSLWIS